MMQTLRRLNLAAFLALAMAPSTFAQGGGSSIELYREFAQQLENEFRQCEHSLFDSSIDFDQLMHRATRGLDPPAGMVAAFIRGVRSSFQLGSQICEGIAASGSYRLLDLRRQEGRPQALFRFVSEGGLNYHDLLLVALPGGQIKITDIYVYLSGEWMSQSLRRGFLPLLIQRNKGFIDKLLGRENTYIKNLDNILKMQKLAREGQTEESLKVFYELPAELRKDRNLLIQRFNIATQAGEDEYQAAMMDIKQTFPNDQRLALLMVDYYFLRQDFDRAFELVDRVDVAVGGDAYLDFLRANLSYGAQKLDQAKRFARQAIDEEPDLEDAYWTLVTISLDEKDFATTAQLLTEIEASLGSAIADLTQIDVYSEFVRSPEYRRWLQTRNRN